MDINGVISAIFVGIVIGLIARILVPSMQPIGCIVTIIIGILAAFAGIFVAQGLDYDDSFWLTFLTQIFIAVVLVAITAFLFRKSNTS
jgi:uncharacterized membrane protein YeaQ/YmgE (transglycosylase-associated protein family)